MMQWGSGFGGFGMILWWLLIIGLVIGVVNILTKSNNYISSTSREVNRSSQSPMEILKERYAKGEIIEEEYIKMRKNLRDD